MALDLFEHMTEITALYPYIIMDEFHRAGAEHWGERVQKLLVLCPDAKLLGLTATNIRYLDNNRDMAEELFDGRIASEMTLDEPSCGAFCLPKENQTEIHQS